MTEIGVHLLDHADDVPTKDVDALFAGSGVAAGSAPAAIAGGAGALGGSHVGEGSDASAIVIDPGRAVAATGAITVDLREVLLA